jgi:hypothetical protein
MLILLENAKKPIKSKNVMHPFKNYFLSGVTKMGFVTNRKKREQATKSKIN